MTELWGLLTLELGSAFKNQYGNANGTTFRHWCKELGEFSRDDLQRGFYNFKNSEKTYMSLNIFRNHCKVKAEDIGLPAEEAAFDAVIFGRWSELPESFQVLFAEHRYNLRRLSADAARKRFKDLYKESVNRIASGESIKKPERVQIANPSGTVHVKKCDGPTGNEAIKNLLGMMGKKRSLTN